MPGSPSLWSAPALCDITGGRRSQSSAGTRTSHSEQAAARAQCGVKVVLIEAMLSERPDDTKPEAPHLHLPGPGGAHLRGTPGGHT